MSTETVEELRRLLATQRATIQAQAATIATLNRRLLDVEELALFQAGLRLNVPLHRDA